MIKVFWKRYSSPIQGHQCRLLICQLFFYLHIYSLCYPQQFSYRDIFTFFFVKYASKPSCNRLELQLRGELESNARRRRGALTCSSSIQEDYRCAWESHGREIFLETQQSDFLRNDLSRVITSILPGRYTWLDQSFPPVLLEYRSFTNNNFPFRRASWWQNLESCSSCTRPPRATSDFWDESLRLCLLYRWYKSPI